MLGEYNDVWYNVPFARPSTCGRISNDHHRDVFTLIESPANNPIDDLV